MIQIIKDKAPLRVANKNKIYELVRQCNEDLYLYKSVDYGYHTTFSRYDLGMVLPPNEIPSYKAHRLNYGGQS